MQHINCRVIILHARQILLAQVSLLWSTENCFSSIGQRVNHNSNYNLIITEGATSLGNDGLQEDQHNASTRMMQDGPLIRKRFFTPMPMKTIATPHHQSFDYSNKNNWVQLAYNEARHYTEPNYKGARVRVVFQLQVKQWRHLLCDYSMNRVCDYIEFGFPLSLDYENFTFNTSITNHASALQLESNSTHL